MCISYEDVANQDVVTSATTCMNEIQGIIDKLTRSYRSKEYMLTLQHYDSMLACLGLETVACMIVDRNAHLSALTQNGRFTFELNDPEATRQLQAALKEAEKRLERDEGGLDKETLLLYHIRRQIEQAWGYALLAALYGTPEQTEHHLDIIEDYERFFECTSYYLRVMIKPSTSAKETMYSFHIAEQCMTSEVVAAAMAKHVPTNSTELTEIVVAAQSYHTRLTLATADTMEHYFVRCMKTEDCLTVFTRMLDSGFVPLSTRPFAMLFNSNSIWSDEIFKYYELMLDYGIAPELSTLRILCKQCPEQGARNHFSMLISMLTEKQGKSASEPTRGQASSAAAAGRSVYTPNRNTTNDHASGELAGEGADGQGSTAQSRMRHSTFFSYRLNLLANEFKLSHLCLSQPAGGGGGSSHSNNNNNSTSNSSACSNFGSATTHAVRQGPDSHVPRSQHTEKNKIVVAAVAESAKPQDKPDHLQRAGSMLMEAMRCIYRAEVEGTSLRHDAHVLRRLIVHFCNGDTPLSDLTYPFRPLAITRRPLTALASAPAPILSSSILPPNNNNNNNNNSNNNSNANNNTNSNTNKDNDSCNLRMDGDTHDTNQSSTSDPGARMNAVVYMDPSRPSEGGTRVQEEACARRRRRILEHALDEVMSDGNDDDDEDDDDDDDDEVADEAVSDDGGGVAGPRQGGSDSFLHLSAASAQRKELMEATKAEEGGSAAHTDEASGTIASPTGRATPAEEAQYVFNVMADYGILPDNRLLRVLVNRLKEHECDVAMMEVTLQSMFYHNRQSRGARPPVPCRSCLPLLHLYLRRRMRHRAIELVRWVVLEFYEYTALFQADWGGKAVPTSGMAGEAAGAAAEGSMSGALGGSGIAAGGLVGCGVNNNNNSNTNTINPRDAVERAEEPNSVTFMKFIHVSMRAGPLDWTLGVLALTLAIVDGELIPRILSSLLHFYDSTPARSVHREVMCALHHCGWKRDKILCCDALMLEPHEQMQGGALSAEPTTNTNTNTNAAEDALAEGRAHSASGVYTQAMHEAGSHPSHTRGPSAAPTLLSYMNIVLREMGMSRTVTEWFRMRLLDARAAALKHSRGCVRAGG